MTHQHLCFELRNSLDCNADYDDDGSTAKCNLRIADDVAGNDRQQSNDCKIQRTEKDDLIDGLSNELCGRTARTEARDETAVLLEVVGDFDRIVLNRCIIRAK